ncbi:unnamed protein product, partial [Rotaria sordida]
MATGINYFTDGTGLALGAAARNSIIGVILNFAGVVVAGIIKPEAFEYYGNDYELSEVQPTKTIPIPKSIMMKCVERESKKKKSVHVDGSEQKEKSCIEIMEDKHSEKFTTADDNETMEIND